MFSELFISYVNFRTFGGKVSSVILLNFIKSKLVWSKRIHALCDFTSRIVSKRSLGKGEDTKKHKEKNQYPPQRICWTRSKKKKKTFWQLSTYFDFIVTFREQPALWTNRRLVTVGFISRFNPISGSNTRKITIDWLIGISHMHNWMTWLTVWHTVAWTANWNMKYDYYWAFK